MQPALFKGIHPTIRQVTQRDRQAQPLTPADLKLAEQVYRRSLRARCSHTPPCAEWTGCIRKLAREMKQKGYL